MQKIDYLTKALKELNAGWLSIENYDYNKIEWEENTTIPTLEEVNNKIEELKLAEPMNKLREERKNKLKESDIYGLSDFNFVDLHFLTKYFLIFFMIIGRIELLTILILFKKFLFKN